MFKPSSKILIAALLAAQSAFAAPTESARCSESNDSLDVAQAAARTKWAFRCYPGLRGSMKNGEAMLKDTATGQSFPGYPTFAVIDPASGDVVSYWQAPIDENAPCDGAETHGFVGFCRAGCYTPDQLVLFMDGFKPILRAKHMLHDGIMTLSKSATIDQLSFKASQLDSYTADPAVKSQPILSIRTQDGGELKVTLHHPLVDSQGRMRAANTLTVGESLVKMDGDPDRIVSIEQQTYVGKVYNVRPASTERSENIVVAQGYLNGSVFYQNEGVGELNRVALRAGNIIPSSLVK